MSSQIQSVLFELDTSYYGHPYYVSGNALYAAIAQSVPGAVASNLRVSMGSLFVGEYGKIPAATDESRRSIYSTSLPDVERYEDLFIFRDAAQRWLLDSRAREVHNCLTLENHGGRIAVAPQCRFGRPPGGRRYKRTVKVHIHCYLQAYDRQRRDILPIEDDDLDEIQVGGGRNFGLGQLTLVDTQLIDLDELSYASLHGSDTFEIDLYSPYVLHSEHPSGDDQSVPWWWETEQPLRERQTKLAFGDHCYDVQTIDHGQTVRYVGDAPIETARNGINRIGTHSKIGFGEFRVRPTTVDRVTEMDGSSAATQTRVAAVRSATPQRMEDA